MAVTLNNSLSCTNSNLDGLNRPSDHPALNREPKVVMAVQAQNNSIQGTKSDLSAKTIKEAAAGPIERALLIIGGLGLVLGGVGVFIFSAVSGTFAAMPGTLFYVLMGSLLATGLGMGLIAAGIAGRSLNQI